MIRIVEKSKCCGCEACVQICPRHCISFEPDAEGFRYPKVDVKECVDCGACERVCPELNIKEKHLPKEVIAAYITDETVRESSSSGGIFSLLANQVIDAGGVVFGVRFDDDWLAVFDCAETREQVVAFRGSKYLQARVDDSFIRCKKLLEEGRKVLFSGTPCQIAALHLFLAKPYDNLQTVDFVCHGVPSPMLWSMYLDEIVSPGCQSIRSISFRDKRRGWKHFSPVINYTQEGKACSHDCSFWEDLYTKAFILNLTIRPSCYSCPAKGGRSQSDITIGDFWGINQVNPMMDDDGGTSLVMVHTDKDCEPLRKKSIKWVPASYEDVLKYNPAFYKSCDKHPHREQFFSSINKGKSLQDLIVLALRPTVLERVKSLTMSHLRIAKRLIKRLLN